MRRSALAAIACLAALAAIVAPASAAAPNNGMLAAVADGKIVTLNPDGSGLRTLWTPPSAGELTGLAWSPDGNKLAFSYGGKLVVYDLPAAKATQLPNDGARDVDPAWWWPEGRRLMFRRISSSGQSRASVASDLSDLRTNALDQVADTFAWAPNFAEWALTVGPLMFWSGSRDPLFEIVSGVTGTPAWSPDSKRLAYSFVNPFPPPNPLPPDGLVVQTLGDGSGRFRVAAPPAAAPRWSPDGNLLVFLAGGGLRTAPAAEAAQVATVPGIAGVTSVDWQPCVTGAYADCESVSPPTCKRTLLTVTTQADQSVDLPDPECTSPGSRATSVVMVKGPEHGSLTGQRYRPAAGFVGQDEMSYRVSNGFGESELVTVRIFVVKRAEPLPSPPSVTPAVVGAPYLTARSTPRLDRKRTTLVSLACDQNCSFEVRLTGTLKKPKKTLRSALVKRSLVKGQVLALRLKLPKKPKGTLKTVWVTGTVRNAAGDKRTVKLPVRLPR